MSRFAMSKFASRDDRESAILAALKTAEAERDAHSAYAEKHREAAAWFARKLIEVLEVRHPADTETNAPEYAECGECYAGANDHEAALPHKPDCVVGAAVRYVATLAENADHKCSNLQGGPLCSTCGADIALRLDKHGYATLPAEKTLGVFRECPSCGGSTTPAMRPDIVEYGQPPVALPYICPVIRCKTCGDFSGAEGEDARAAVVKAWQTRTSQCGDPK